MEKRIELQKLIDKSISNSCRIPNFIDCKTKEGHMAWSITSNILNEISMLINERIFTEKQMLDFYDNIVFLESNYINIKNNELYKKCVNHINKLIWGYMDKALEIEEYETVANFKQFKVLMDGNDLLITDYIDKKL